MQEFILDRKADNSTTAVDQAMMKVFKDLNIAKQALQSGLLAEGEVFSTIEDSNGNATIEDEVRDLQERVETLEGSTGDIASVLPEDVSVDNLLATVKTVLDAIQALDYAKKGGDGKYIKTISEYDGLISATEGTIDSAIVQDSENPASSDAVFNYVETTRNGLNQDIQDVADRVTDIEEDYLTSADKASLQTSINSKADDAQTTASLNNKIDKSALTFSLVGNDLYITKSY